MVTIKFGFDEALTILLPCEIHPFSLMHPVLYVYILTFRTYTVIVTSNCIDVKVSF
jgi:hypothetical protein